MNWPGHDKVWGEADRVRAKHGKLGAGLRAISEFRPIPAKTSPRWAGTYPDPIKVGRCSSDLARFWRSLAPLRARFC